MEVIVMKIAVASDGSIVSAHFGHCESFTIFEVEDKKVVKKEVVPSPGHTPGHLPVFLEGLGVNVIMSGGMGGKAIDLFNAQGIDVITGARGDVDTLVDEYLKGNIESAYSVCQEHAHRGSRGDCAH